MQEQLFVDREREVAELRGYLDKALAGRGQVCFVTGEAGSGKTALVRHFVEDALATHPDLVLAMGTCDAQTGMGDPYLPFREALTMLTGDEGAQQAAGRIASENATRLRAVLARSVQVLVEVAPELIGLFVPGVKLVGYLGKAVATRAGWMAQLDELAKRRRSAGDPAADQSHIFEQYTAFLQHLSAKTPLILFLDDLQWADGASIGLLFHLGRQLEGSRILVLGAYRPNDVALGRDGKRHPLEAVVHELTRYYADVTVDLDAIPDAASRAFVDALLDAEPNRLGPSFRQALFHRTGGHALFTVELLRDMQERSDLVRDGDGRWEEGASLDWDALPARVEGVIAERIGRLSEELRQMLTVASVEGEQFTAEVVARVQAISEREAVRELSNDLQRQHRLVSALGMFQLGPLHLSLYRFLHNLFQQYLYNSLCEAERAYLHRDVGEVMEGLFAGQTEEVAAQLARHFEEAGLPHKAAAYRLQAGNRARRMSAHLEAVAHLQRGLQLLDSLPMGAERLQLELGLQGSLGMALMATQGYASAEVEQAFGRAREICRLLGDPPPLFQVLYGQLIFYFVRGDLERVREEGEALLRRAEQSQEVTYVLGCHLILGGTAIYLADYATARQHLEQALALYDPVAHRNLAYEHGQDPGVVSLAYLSWVLWFQGYPEQALTKVYAAVQLADTLNHRFTQTLANFFAGWLHQMLGQWPESRTRLETSLRLATQGHYAVWQAYGNVHQGATLVHQGDVDDGLAQLRRGLAGREASGANLGASGQLAILAEACLFAQKREQGLEAYAQSFRGPETWWLPEQYRVGAELLLLPDGGNGQDREAEAEAGLRQALELAHNQGSRPLELRAATSLARLLRRRGKLAEAGDLLQACYKQFSEGFETTDLREARELLAELAPLQPETQAEMSSIH